MLSRDTDGIRVSEDGKAAPVAWSSEGHPLRQMLLVVLTRLRLGSATDMKVSTDTFVQELSTRMTSS